MFSRRALVFVCTLSYRCRESMRLVDVRYEDGLIRLSNMITNPITGYALFVHGKALAG